MTALPVSTYDIERSRIELHAGDELVAWVDLRPGGPSSIIAHTEVVPGHEGEGLGQAAVRAAVEHIVGEGKSVIALCPFARAVLARQRSPRLANTPGVRGAHCGWRPRQRRTMTADPSARTPGNVRAT